MASILLVDDDPASLRYIETVLNRMGHRCQRASNGVEALLGLEERMPDLVVSDVQMPEMDGLELLARARERWPDLPVLLISVKDDVELVVRGVQAGAVNYLLKPCPPKRVRDVVEKALRERQPRRAHGSSEIGEIIGRSQAMVQVRHSVALAARSDVGVLLCGETGVGKEVVARSIHRHSNQRGGSLIAHNCSTAPRDLFESIFFGHRKGAFTGADSDQKGLLQQAHGGILFLDELEAMSPEQQTKLLRVLDDGEMRTLGEARAVHVDVRFIAATNCPPLELIRQQRLREDLYYRLRGIEIVLPPLRARGKDVGLLALHFLGDKGSLSIEALEALATYEWPGNVRELKNAIESARIRAGGGRIDPHHLQLGAIEWPIEGIRQGGGVMPSAGMPAKSLREAEGDLIQRTLNACGGNQSRAARVLGINRSTLRRKLARLDSG